MRSVRRRSPSCTRHPPPTPLPSSRRCGSTPGRGQTGRSSRRPSALPTSTRWASGPLSLQPSPYTPHPAPYTLHPTSYTPHTFRQPAPVQHTLLWGGRISSQHRGWRRGAQLFHPSLAGALTSARSLSDTPTRSTRRARTNPPPETRNPKPCTRNTKSETPNPKPSTLNPQPSTLNPKPQTLHPAPKFSNHPPPKSLNANPQTTLNPTP